ncbi:MAG: aldose 1-epimerase family protein [Clostridia bacterium]
MEFTIANKHITVTASELGAELREIKGADGIRFLWQGDPDSWMDRAPNLFPYIARLTNGRYTYNGKSYTLPIHGFAPTSEFQMTFMDETRMTFSLVSSSQTLKHYPFEFLLEVMYEVRENTLALTYKVENLTGDTMYFGIGAHPGFNVPLDVSERFEDYYLDFGEPCSSVRIGFSEDCFLNGKDTPFQLEEKQKLALSHSLFDNDAIVLKEMPKTVTLKSKHGQHCISIHYPGMKYLGLWHAPHTTANYICIEPWSSLPSRKDIVEDLEQQKDLLSLPAGEVYKTTVTFIFV